MRTASAIAQVTAGVSVSVQRSASPIVFLSINLVMEQTALAVSTLVPALEISDL